MRNMRCAFVFMAIAAHMRPVSGGSPPPLISFHVTPSSVDLNRCVPLGTLLGGAVGWRTAFYGIATLTTVVAVSTAAALPPTDEVPRVAAQTPLDRPRILLTLATTLLWATGTGADVTRRLVAPLVGGIAVSFLMELLVYPVVYYLAKRWELGHALS